MNSGSGSPQPLDRTNKDSNTIHSKEEKAKLRKEKWQKLKSTLGPKWNKGNMSQSINSSDSQESGSKSKETYEPPLKSSINEQNSGNGSQSSVTNTKPTFNNSTRSVWNTNSSTWNKSWGKSDDKDTSRSTITFAQKTAAVSQPKWGKSTAQKLPVWAKNHKNRESKPLSSNTKDSVSTHSKKITFNESEANKQSGISILGDVETTNTWASSSKSNTQSGWTWSDNVDTIDTFNKKRKQSWDNYDEGNKDNNQSKISSKNESFSISTNNDRKNTFSETYIDNISAKKCRISQSYEAHLDTRNSSKDHQNNLLHDRNNIHKKVSYQTANGGYSSYSRRASSNNSIDSPINHVYNNVERHRTNDQYTFQQGSSKRSISHENKTATSTPWDKQYPNELNQIVNADGIVLVRNLPLKEQERKDNDINEYHFSVPWPGRILGTTEYEELKTKIGNNIGDHAIFVYIYFPPPILYGTHTAHGYCQEWKKIMCVHRTQLELFSQDKQYDIENLIATYWKDNSAKSTAQMNLFWKSWNLVSGLRQWALTSNLQPQLHSDNIHHHVGDYGAVLAIEKEKWLKAGDIEDPDHISKMIQNHPLCAFLGDYNSSGCNTLDSTSENINAFESSQHDSSFGHQEMEKPRHLTLIQASKGIDILTTKDDMIPLTVQSHDPKHSPRNENISMEENSTSIEIVPTENSTLMETLDRHDNAERTNTELESKHQEGNDEISKAKNPKLSLENPVEPNRIVKVDGICLVTGVDETRSMHLPWPARVLCADECVAYRAKEKKSGRTIPKNHVSLVYFFPCWGTDTGLTPKDQWYRYASVEPSRIYEFRQSIIDLEGVSKDIFQRFMKGWIVAEGLQNWALGTDMKVTKKKIKIHATINPIHSDVGDYGEVLVIPDDNWLKATENLDAIDIVNMICNCETIKTKLPQYDAFRVKRILENNGFNKGQALNLEEILKNEMKNKSLNELQNSGNSLVHDKKANPIPKHQLMYVMDESRGPGRLTNGETVTQLNPNESKPEPTQSNSGVPNLSSGNPKMLADLFKDYYKRKSITEESKSCFERLARILENADSTHSCASIMASLLGTRILELEQTLKSMKEDR